MLEYNEKKMFIHKMHHVIGYVIGMVILMAGIDMGNWLIIKNDFDQFLFYLQFYFMVILILFFLYIFLILFIRRYLDNEEGKKFQNEKTSYQKSSEHKCWWED